MDRQNVYSSISYAKATADMTHVQETQTDITNQHTIPISHFIHFLLLIPIEDIQTNFSTNAYNEEPIKIPIS